MSDFTDAVDRLDTLYNGNAYNATTNPGGLDGGGHTVNFVPSLRDQATLGQGVSSLADTAVAAAATATTKASEASTSAGLAATAQTDAEAAAAAAEASAILADGVPKGTGTTTGDLIVYPAPSTPGRLGIGSQGQVLTPISGVPGWGEAPVGGECRLDYTSATVLTLSRYNGHRIVIDNVARSIPAAGVTLANPGVADTTYYIYAYWTGSVIALEHSTTAYAVDSRNGVMGKTGDATRALVGMARTNNSGQWVSSDTQRYVISWFNRTQLRFRLLTTSDFSTASSPFVSVGVSGGFICWAGFIALSMYSVAKSSVAESSLFTALFIDESQASHRSIATAVSRYGSIGTASVGTQSAGYHTADIRAGINGGGTGTWASGEVVAIITIMG